MEATGTPKLIKYKKFPEIYVTVMVTADDDLDKVIIGNASVELRAVISEMLLTMPVAVGGGSVRDYYGQAVVAIMRDMIDSGLCEIDHIQGKYSLSMEGLAAHGSWNCPTSAEMSYLARTRRTHNGPQPMFNGENDATRRLNVAISADLSDQSDSK